MLLPLPEDLALQSDGSEIEGTTDSNGKVRHPTWPTLLVQNDMLSGCQVGPGGRDA